MRRTYLGAKLRPEPASCAFLREMGDKPLNDEGPCSLFTCRIRRRCSSPPFAKRDGGARVTCRNPTDHPFLKRSILMYEATCRAMTDFDRRLCLALLGRNMCSQECAGNQSNRARLLFQWGEEGGASGTIL